MLLWTGTLPGPLQADETRAQKPLCGEAPPGFQLRTFQDAAGSHRYAVFVPQQYDPSVKWPVLLFLHGAGEKGTDGLLPVSGTLAVALERWRDAPFIAVFPQCEDLGGRSLLGWLPTSAAGQRARQILDQVEKDFSIDPARRMLVGWSMGGYGAWSQAAADPEHWSAMLTLAGGAVPDTIDLHALAQSHLPVWAISGEQDPLISPQESRRLVDELNQLGGNGTFTLLTPGGHNVCPEVFADRQVFDWLLNPDQIDRKTVHFDQQAPLPLRTDYYRQCQVQARKVPGALGVRLGNQALHDLSAQLASRIPESATAGKLPDVRQVLGTGDSAITVTLSNLSYQAHVAGCGLKAISGGRFGIEIGLRPLELRIGQTELNSQRHFARAEDIKITIGLREPALLKLEVRPEMVDGVLRLVPLRKEFLFHDSNWYVSPPASLEARSPDFTAAQLTSGIIGSLYQSRAEIDRQVLSAVPGMLESLEKQLRPQAVPGLARVLSPLPVLVPELEIGTQQVSTDTQGVSLICDLYALSRQSGPELIPKQPLQLASLRRADELTMDILLETVTLLSTVTVEQASAIVNVLDISDEKFTALAQPESMARVFPDLKPDQPGPLKSVLQLATPMILVEHPRPESEPDATALILSASRLFLDVSQPDEKQGFTLVGRIEFSLEQPITIRPRPDRDADQAGYSVRWEPDSRVTFQRAVDAQGQPIENVHGAAFEELFGAAWRSWADENGDRSISASVARFGHVDIRLKQISAEDGQFQAHLSTEVSATPER
jgi:predicted esterase